MFDSFGCKGVGKSGLVRLRQSVIRCMAYYIDQVDAAQIRDFPFSDRLVKMIKKVSGFRM